MITVPLSPESLSYEQEVNLDGTSVVMRFDFNPRDQTYYLSLFDPQTVPDSSGYRQALVAGIPIHVGQDLLAPFVDRSLPQGILYAFDTSGQDLDPGANELGVRVVLVFIPEGEIDGS